MVLSTFVIVAASMPIIGRQLWAIGVQNPKSLRAQVSGAQRAFVATDRIRAEQPLAKPKLGVIVRIPLTIQVQGINRLHSTQHYRDPDRQNLWETPATIPESITELPIQQMPDGSSYVEILPLRFGTIILELLGKYPDGGVVMTKVAIDVGLPDVPPSDITVGQLGAPGKNLPFIEIYLTHKQPEPSRRWHFGAKYKGIEGFVPVDANFARFEFRTLDNRPVIQFDQQTGTFKPIEPGEELVETQFGGWTNLTCVVVIDVDAPESKPRRHGCRTLLRFGEKLANPVRTLDQ